MTVITIHAKPKSQVLSGGSAAAGSGGMSIDEALPSLALKTLYAGYI